MKKNKTVILWEAPVIVKPEFRLYYNKSDGKVICYTCEKLEGDYIVIDATVFAECRPDVKVVDGKIVTAIHGSVVTKLVPSDTEGIQCDAEDVSVVKASRKKTKKWKLKTHEQDT